VDWTQKLTVAEDAGTLKYWTHATDLLPTDGIVRKTAQEAIRGANTDAEKAQKLFDWIVANTFREPKVRGCGEGDIKAMLETGNLGGNSASLKGAQHCRAEVYLKAHGWVGMDPAAENANGRLDSYAPDDFKYQISAKEIRV
jgi:transglutaminase-like putative cysteine protease